MRHVTHCSKKGKLILCEEYRINFYDDDDDDDHNNNNNYFL